MWGRRRIELGNRVTGLLRIPRRSPTCRTVSEICERDDRGVEVTHDCVDIAFITLYTFDCSPDDSSSADIVGRESSSSRHKPSSRIVVNGYVQIGDPRSDIPTDLPGLQRYDFKAQLRLQRLIEVQEDKAA